MSKYKLRFFKASFFLPPGNALIDKFQKNQALIDSLFLYCLFGIGKTIIRFWSSNKTVADGWEPLGVCARVPKMIASNCLLFLLSVATGPYCDF